MKTIPVRFPTPSQLHRVVAAGILFVAAAALATTAAIMRVHVPWQAPTVNLDKLPTGIAFESETNTIYVTNTNSNNVTVIDASRCNASDTSHCVPAATMSDVGRGPISLAIDQTSHTLYVTDGFANMAPTAAGSPS